MSTNAIADDAKTLLLNEYHGVLSTHSADMPGFPFGSVVPYCLDSEGVAIILISSIAQHTKNIEADNKVSLIVTEHGVDDIQKAERLTLLCEAKKIPRENLATIHRYCRFFSSARENHLQLNFDFYRLQPVKARFIGGFGKIHWVSSERLLHPHAFSNEEESGMVSHMNEDHLAAIQKYCLSYDIATEENDVPVMVGVDALGCNIRVGEKISRIQFSEEALDSTAVRARLVAMARA